MLCLNQLLRKMFWARVFALTQLNPSRHAGTDYTGGLTAAFDFTSAKYKLKSRTETKEKY